MVNMNAFVLQEKLNKYTALRDTVKRVIQQLSNSIESISVSADDLGECLSIDDFRADSGQIDNCRNGLSGQKSNLETRILPSINQEIARIEQEIEALAEEDA